MSPWGRNKDKSKLEDTTLLTDGRQPSAETSAASQELDSASKPFVLRNIVQSDPNEGQYGLKILHEPEDAIVDIVFVHGLTGNRETTWTRNAGKRTACFWPQDLLPDEEHGVSNARIATWGYDADVVNNRPLAVVSKNTIEQHAESLCTDLANYRTRNAADRPLIFVVHSLGGLVVKTALLHANESRTKVSTHIHATSESTCGVLFMGTPHRGSEQARWGGILASILGYIKQDNAELVHRLNKEEPQLALLQQRFSKFLEDRKDRERPVSIACCFEELPVPIIGLIVPAFSAQLDPYPAIAVHADHLGMTKFGGDDSTGYVRVLGELKRWVNNVATTDETDLKKPSPTRTGISYTSAAMHHHGHVLHSGNIAQGGVGLYGNQTISGSHIGGVHHVHGSEHDR